MAIKFYRLPAQKRNLISKLVTEIIESTTPVCEFQKHGGVFKLASVDLYLVQTKALVLKVVDKKGEVIIPETDCAFKPTDARTMLESAVDLQRDGCEMACKALQVLHKLRTEQTKKIKTSESTPKKVETKQTNSNKANAKTTTKTRTKELEDELTEGDKQLINAQIQFWCKSRRVSSPSEYLSRLIQRHESKKER